MEESQRKKADQAALRLWHINETMFCRLSSLPGGLRRAGHRHHARHLACIPSWNCWCGMGFSPREALAAATNNYALQFGWNELGLIAPGRRADILVLDADPTLSIWNARRISTPDDGRQRDGPRCAAEFEKVDLPAIPVVRRAGLPPAGFRAAWLGGAQSGGQAGVSPLGCQACQERRRAAGSQRYP